MDIRLTWIDCDEAGDYVVPNVLCPMDLFSRPENMDETILNTHIFPSFFAQSFVRTAILRSSSELPNINVTSSPKGNDRSTQRQ